MKSRNVISSIVMSIIALLFCFNDVSWTGQVEKILNFDSFIQVHPDGSMTVTETIKVICAGDRIKRGIFRTFPTRYDDRYGNTLKVKFEILSILKNGQPEPYHIEKASNGVIVYIGHADVFLKHGIYMYTITYRTDRQLGFFAEFDELYWNVTGNDWDFVIERARALVELPRGAKILNKTGYTGPHGAQGIDFSISTDRQGNISFTTTKPLKPSEGLTIAVSWPKGFVSEPTLRDEIIYILKDNPSTMATLIGLLILIIYYLIAWIMVGQDPSKGIIVPRFAPPKGFSPAATRYVMRMGYSDRVFAAAIVNMAVKGYVTIHEDDGEFSLTRTNNDESVLSSGEKRIAKKLFGRRNSIEFKQKNHTKLKNAINTLKKSLKRDFEKLHFQRNLAYLTPGIVLTFLTLAAVVLTATEKLGAMFMLVWLSGWTVGCFALVFAAVKAWKTAVSAGGSGLSKKGGALGLSLFALPFVGFEIFGLGAFSSMTSPIAALILLVIVFINFLFYHLLKAPTIYGRKIMDQIEGFKLYLSVAEAERLKVLHSPHKIPELFEKYLPYALALDVEHAWSEQFSEVLASASRDHGYSPSWYSGSHWSTLGATGLASSLGSSFSSAISASSAAPGSSSGSGGGGSSGGGGGGGGGGGW